LELGIGSFIVGVAFGLVSGMIAGTHRGSLADYSSMVLAVIGAAAPVFWLGLMALYLLSVKIDVFPIAGRLSAGRALHSHTGFYTVDSILAGDWVAFKDAIRHLALPSVVLAAYPLARTARLTRSCILEVLGQDYIRTAHGKGLKSIRVVLRHALPNALIPVVTDIGLSFGSVLGGAVLTETVFGWPGLGRYIVQSINARDFPVIQAAILLVTCIFALTNLAVDVLYHIIDPRISHG
jgi:peptide/nickel transport system permease protein